MRILGPLRGGDNPTPRVPLPRLERVAMVLLEVADYDLGAVVAAVLLAYEAHERDAA